MTDVGVYSCFITDVTFHLSSPGCISVLMSTLCLPLQVFWSYMRPGSGVRLPCAGPHDLSEATGGAPLALSPVPQLPDPAGLGQPGGSVLHVAAAASRRRGGGISGFTCLWRSERSSSLRPIRVCGSDLTLKHVSVSEGNRTSVSWFDQVIFLSSPCCLAAGLSTSLSSSEIIPVMLRLVVPELIPGRRPLTHCRRPLTH